MVGYQVHYLSSTTLRVRQSFAMMALRRSHQNPNLQLTKSKQSRDCKCRLMGEFQVWVCRMSRYAATIVQMLLACDRKPCDGRCRVLVRNMVIDERLCKGKM